MFSQRKKFKKRPFFPVMKKDAILLLKIWKLQLSQKMTYKTAVLFPPQGLSDLVYS
jgi:hypothetical protein